MKFTISSSLLSSRLQTTGRVIATTNSLPILDSFLFEVNGNNLTITASDNETTLRTNMEVSESDANIRFAVNAKTIQNAMKEIPEQPLEFFINEKTLEVTVDYLNGKYNFMAMAADEYPVPASLADDAQTVNINPTNLYDAVNRALFATADDALRPVMNGIFFDISTEYLTIVASDGHKLSCNKILGSKAAVAGSFILPKRPSMMLKNVLTKETENVTICFDGRNAEIRTANFIMVSRLSEGRYPNYNAVIPQDNPNCVTVNRDAMIAALRRVLIFSSAVSSLVKMRLEPSKMIISSQDTDFSMSAEEAVLCEYNGIPMCIGFKGPFLLELINNLQGDEIVIKLADASRAGVIIPANQLEGEEALMLLMPMMLND